MEWQSYDPKLDFRYLQLESLKTVYSLFSVRYRPDCAYVESNKGITLYTPGIYAAGYIVFALTFVRSSVRMFVRSCVRSFVTFRHVRRIYLKVFG